MYAGCFDAIQRFCYFKLPGKIDGDDVLQEISLTAWSHRELVRSVDSFKPWLMQIAANKIRDFYRRRAKQLDVMDISENNSIFMEHFLDQNGRAILKRRFNRDDWHFDYYKQKWSDKLPGNEQLIVNGDTYVHWYDCISDYIL